MTTITDNLTRNELEKILEEASPRDGFRVEEIDFNGKRSLVLAAYAGGEIVPIPWADNNKAGAYLEIIPEGSLSNSAADRGSMARARLFMEACCRFLNSGGQIAAAESYFRKLEQVGKQLDFRIPGYVLEDSFLCAEGDYVHIFSSEKNDLVVEWVEGVSYDVMTRTEYNKELEAPRDVIRDPGSGEVRLLDQQDAGTSPQSP